MLSGHPPRQQQPALSPLDATVSELSGGRLRVAEFPGPDGSSLRGLCAIRDISQGEPLMSVPVSLMLLPPAPPPLAGPSQQPPLHRLSAALFHALASWPAGCPDPRLSHLRSSALLDPRALAAGVERRLWLRRRLLGQKQLGHAASLLVGRLAGLAEDWLASCPPGLLLSGADDSDFERRRLWLACCHLVNSRVVHCPGLNQIALVPYFDLFNHSPTVAVETAFDSSNGCFTLTTRTAYGAGDQVYINYGNHSNLTLLVEYDFVLGPMPTEHDCVPVGIAALLAPSLLTGFLEQLASLGMCSSAEAVLSDQLTQLKYFHLSMDGPSYYLLLLMMMLNGGRSLADIVHSMSEDQLIDSLTDQLHNLYGQLKTELMHDRNQFAMLTIEAVDDDKSGSDNLLENCVQLMDIWCDIVASLMDNFESTK